MDTWIAKHGPALVSLSTALGAAFLAIVGPLSPETAAVIGGILGAFNLVERVVRAFDEAATPRS